MMVWIGFSIVYVLSFVWALSTGVSLFRVRQSFVGSFDWIKRSRNVYMAQITVPSHQRGEGTINGATDDRPPSQRGTPPQEGNDALCLRLFVSGFHPFRAVVFLHYLIVKDQENWIGLPNFNFRSPFYTHKCQKVSEKVLTFVRNVARNRGRNL
jgi:hypothetical protein